MTTKPQAKWNKARRQFVKTMDAINNSIPFFDGYPPKWWFDMMAIMQTVKGPYIK